MSIATRIRRAPSRIAAGTFILNSGLTKLHADEDTSAMLHGMAAGAYPFLGKIEPKTFTRALATTEVVLGGALLLPIVPAAVAGAGLAAFSGGLLGLYWQTPGMHPDGDPRPTPQGIPLAKDVWMAGIAAGLLADALLPEGQPRRAVRRAERRASKAEAKAAAIDATLTALTQQRSSGRTRERQARQNAKILAAKAKAVGDAARARGVAQAHAARLQAKTADKTVHAQLEDVRSFLGSALNATTSTVQPATKTALDAARSAGVRARDALT